MHQLWTECVVGVADDRSSVEFTIYREGRRKELYLKINYNRITSAMPLVLVQRTLADFTRVNSAICASD